MAASLPESLAWDKCALSDGDLLQMCREGSESAAFAIHHRYQKRVRRLAQQHWPASMRSRYDPDDIVQEVFNCFFRAVHRGFRLATAEAGLWGFFLVVTLNQIRKANARHHSQRRDVRSMVQQTCLDDGVEKLHAGHDCLALSSLVVDELLATLPPGMQQVVSRRLEGFTVPEIARDLAISQRVTERLLQGVRRRMTKFFGGSSTPRGLAPVRLQKGTDKSAPPLLPNNLHDGQRRIRIA